MPHVNIEKEEAISSWNFGFWNTLAMLKEEGWEWKICRLWLICCEWASLEDLRSMMNFLKLYHGRGLRKKKMKWKIQKWNEKWSEKWNEKLEWKSQVDFLIFLCYNNYNGKYILLYRSARAAKFFGQPLLFHLYWILYSNERCY